MKKKCVKNCLILVSFFSCALFAFSVGAEQENQGADLIKENTLSAHESASYLEYIKQKAVDTKNNIDTFTNTKITPHIINNPKATAVICVLILAAGIYLNPTAQNVVTNAWEVGTDTIGALANNGLKKLSDGAACLEPVTIPLKTSIISVIASLYKDLPERKEVFHKVLLGVPFGIATSVGSNVTSEWLKTPRIVGYSNNFMSLTQQIQLIQSLKKAQIEHYKKQFKKIPHHELEKLENIINKSASRLIENLANEASANAEAALDYTYNETEKLTKELERLNALVEKVKKEELTKELELLNESISKIKSENVVKELERLNASAAKMKAEQLAQELERLNKLVKEKKESKKSKLKETNSSKKYQTEPEISQKDKNVKTEAPDAGASTTDLQDLGL